MRYPVIAGRDLTKHYRMGEVDVMALRGVNIELLEGELMVLLGPSGSGKSTLLNIPGGLDVCTAGRVMYRDEDLTSADEDELTRYRRHHVGFVFQFYNLIPSLTARENVALVTEIATGIVYNNARIALSMRSRDLASLRVLGFTRREISSVLLGELGAQVVLGVVLGLVAGRWWAVLLARSFPAESFHFQGGCRA